MREFGEDLFFFQIVLILFADFNHVAKSREKHKRRDSSTRGSKSANTSINGGDEMNNEGGVKTYS